VSQQAGHLEEQSTAPAAPQRAAPRRTGRPRAAAAWLLCTVIGAGLGELSLQPWPPALVWNHTGSVPIGLYKLDRSLPAKGDIVVIAPAALLRAVLDDYGFLPANRLLLKQLAAVEGQTVCRDQALVTIDGAPAAVAKPVTSHGRALPAWSGCRVLAANEVLVLNPQAGSFDSRYFGPISTDQIVGVARPLITLPAKEAS
jgi:conjugative transfer signal peptidase TraF